MRKYQTSMRIELFDSKTPLKFSIYADSNDLTESFAKMMFATYSEISKTRDIGTFEEFIEGLKHPSTTSGVCEVYNDRMAAERKMDGQL